MFPLPFVEGDEYLRDALCEFLGSKQRQSGILWGEREPSCTICTSGGRHGRKAGYEDIPADQGGWFYYGQAAAGDQDVRRSANARLASGNSSILLFTSREPTAAEMREGGGWAKRFKYCGIFHLLGWDWVVPSQGLRKGDRLIRFHFVRVAASEGAEATMEHTPPSNGDNASLRRRLLSVHNAIAPTSARSVAEYRLRSREVKQYALGRAKGICESCGAVGPFEVRNGDRYLEVHHLLRLADDGPDVPRNVAAICPNCHRHAHFGADKHAFSANLLRKIENIEDLMDANCALNC